MTLELIQFMFAYFYIFKIMIYYYIFFLERLLNFTFIK
jgi:hypothetical protein